MTSQEVLQWVEGVPLRSVASVLRKKKDSGEEEAYGGDVLAALSEQGFLRTFGSSVGEVFYDALKKQGTPLRYIAQISPRLSLSVPFTFLSFRPLSWLLHPRRPFFDSKIVRVILLCKLVRRFCPPLARVLPLTRPFG